MTGRKPKFWMQNAHPRTRRNRVQHFNLISVADCKRPDLTYATQLAANNPNEKIRERSSQKIALLHQR